MILILHLYQEENENSSDDHGSDSVEEDAKATPMREVKAEATKEVNIKKKVKILENVGF